MVQKLELKSAHQKHDDTISKRKQNGKEWWFEACHLIITRAKFDQETEQKLYFALDMDDTNSN